ncbi:MAG: MobA/MobL family protein [Lachnospiraceae bacterium]|nr:MobA/MobL family protein [Lachnospiraceae bacterium]MBR6155851.1 MobA/MobL family protein [Lachnospiraceae bacterium]
MALYHFHVDRVSRGAGQSAVAAAAYRAGEKLQDDYYGGFHDYTKKGGVIMSEILLPENAPERFSDRQTLWNELEKVEKHPKAQLAYSFDFALQNELSREENIRIAREFIMQNFVARGMICDVAFHDPGKGEDDIPNPHVHVLAPIRPLKEDGSWGSKQHREYVLDENGNRIKGPDGEDLFNAVWDTDWGRPETLQHWRAEWARTVNEAFERNGIPERVDHRSYIDQGLDLLPQVHEGPKVRAMEARGLKTDKGEWNRFIKSINKALTKILNTFKSILEDIEERKKAEALAREENRARAKELFEALGDYEKEIRQKYTYARGKIASRKMLDLYQFVLNNNIHDLEDFKDYSKLMYDKLSGIRQEMKGWEEKVKACDKVLERYKIYKEFRPVYQKWYRIADPRKKKAFAEKYEPQLNAYHMAERELKKQYPDMKIPVNKLIKERDGYKAQIQALKPDLEKYKKAASQAYAFKKQIYDQHKTRKREAERSR